MRRFRSLDEIDGDHWKDEGISPYSTGMWGVRQAARAKVSRSRQVSLPLLGIGNYCWCGLAYKHDWPGKAEGMPHPRSK